MEIRNPKRTAVPLSIFGRINREYDVDEALPKPRPAWWRQARCRTLPVTQRDVVFFPSPGGLDIYSSAKIYCNACPVKQDCLDASVREEGIGVRKDICGMRGGKTPAQRWEHLKELRQQGLISKRTNLEAYQRLGRFESHSQYKQEHGDARRARNHARKTHE